MAALDMQYKMSIRLMTILGLWPYVNVNVRRIQSAFVNCFCTTLVIAQVIPIMINDMGLVKLLQCLSFIIMVLGSVVKFNAFLSAIGAIKEIMDIVKDKWNTTHKDTLDILEKRAILGKEQGAIYAIFIYPSALFAMLFRVTAYVLVATAPPNKNQTDLFPMMTDYLVDGEKNFLFITIHQSITFFFVATIYVATETLFIMWLQHSIALYELASYHIVKGISVGPSYISEEVMDVYRNKCLAAAVSYHKEAKIFTMNMKDRFSFSYAALLVFAVVSLSINFFRLSFAICVSHNVEEMLLSLLFSISELVYMFYLNYVVQQLLDYSEDFPTIVYSTPWYQMSVSIQKNLLIILTRCSEPLIIDFYGFYNASVEGFSGLVKSTMSYFMMMTSLQ